MASTMRVSSGLKAATDLPSSDAPPKSIADRNGQFLAPSGHGRKYQVH